MLLAASVVAAVSASRVALRVHYPVDVLGGIVIGGLTSLSLYTALRRLGRRGFSYASSALGLALGLAGGLLYSSPTALKLAGVALALPAYPYVRTGRELGLARGAACSALAVAAALSASMIFDAAGVGGAALVPAYAAITLLILTAPRMAAALSRAPAHSQGKV